MSAKITTLPGHAIPPAPRHAITTHLPSWEMLLRFAKDKDPEVINMLESMYPRMILHRDVKELMTKIIEYAGVQNTGQTCRLFPSIQAARDCKVFATSAARGEGALRDDQLTIHAFTFESHADGAIKNKVNVYAVFFPVASTSVVHGFWTHSGTGISSRMAEYCLQHIDTLDESERHQNLSSEAVGKLTMAESLAHHQIKDRITTLLKRAPIEPSRTTRLAPHDVYLYSTGMSAIYWVHKCLLSKYGSKTVLFGFSFSSTIHVLGAFGPGVEFFGQGDDDDLKLLEEYLSSQKAKDQKVQAIWTEVPSNPLLNTPDLKRLRELADRYGALLIVDDTIGSFCNIDAFGVADILVTSLTKSFSGYADVLASSAVLNPSASRYVELKALFDETYLNFFFVGDAETLERNSRNYLERSAVLNKNAEKIVEYLVKEVDDPHSPVKRVYYPTTSKSVEIYQSMMRPETRDFKPGYGCLFSVEFESLDAAVAFYNNLNVHLGPHLGAHLTLAIGYCMGVYPNEQEWVAQYGLLPTQIRVSAGLEETETLLEDFRVAVEAAKAAADTRTLN
ncbi:hypothetical protein PV08_05964 [Exophiala spinifera]|uniref:Cystathionine gamma-synthase n=1 Tax=Exophiala spinifera TaxID=91928 RepID=A0A0D2BX92_9EURO|nr:uncharacterized protein PV08_05964 [Exophiala spinifera]KIW15914.1 hypothetical protein PV08_05964 [Exophiala spinifera]